MKPPLVYYGGKTRLAERIATRLPPHKHYVEPFGGSLAVLFAKHPSPHETVNDLDGNLMLFWRMLRDRPEDLIRACALTPHSHMEYDLSKTLTDVEELERARRVWVALTQSRSGTRRSTGWRRFVAPGDSIGMPARLNTYVERMGKCAERLHNVSIESRPATELILEMGKHRDVLIYADPPYLGSTRQSNYRYEMLGEEEHRELAEQLHDCEASVVLSGYASELYDTLYKDWDRVEFITTANSGAPRIEVLWSNSPLKVDLWGVEGERNE